MHSYPCLALKAGDRPTLRATWVYGFRDEGSPLGNNLFVVRGIYPRTGWDEPVPCRMVRDSQFYERN